MDIESDPSRTSEMDFINGRIALIAAKNGVREMNKNDRNCIN